MDSNYPNIKVDFKFREVKPLMIKIIKIIANKNNI